MDLFEAIKLRRSIRRFKKISVPEVEVRKALEAATLAPNSSNTQTWDFFWVRSEDKKSKLVQYCLNQSAARTAAELIVISVDPKLWKRSQPGLIKWVKDSEAPPMVHAYYEKLIPVTYRWGFFNIIGYSKKIVSFVVGMFRPFLRGPHTKRDLQEMAMKSAALACENLVLALTAQGIASCMMEGFDEVRVKKLLKLSRSARVVMVIGLGYADEKGTWGPQYRLPLEKVIHEV